ncbi:MAG: hypothetical protein EXQ94_05930 [Alphaproteobacteria bacterium]|nr:hypothetical protein [Alphaproteobacteria bacterium]
MANKTGTPGADSLRGTASVDTLRGEGGSDQLFGLGGIDRLEGGVGNDTLDGGIGNDSLLGGAGNDVYIVDNVRDRITEAAAGGTDTVRSGISFVLPGNVENLIFTGTGAINGSGNTSANSMAGNGGKNVLLGLAGNDRLDGGSGNDSLIGGAGIDSLVGGVGNDRLDGRSGADVMSGGTGSDVYLVDDVGDLVQDAVAAAVGSISLRALGNPIQAALAGDVDVVQSDTIDLDLEDLAPDGGIEIARVLGDQALNIIGDTDSAQSLAGNDTQNTLTGGSANDTQSGGAGNDSLIGNDGDDTLDGGADSDAMAGGDGNDVYVVDQGDDDVIELAGAGSGTDTIRSSVGFTVPENVENLTLIGTGNIDGEGNDAGGSYSGAAYVVFGTDQGLGTIDLDDVAAGEGGFKIIGENNSDRAGTVALAGDINGVGFDDLIVGAYRNTAGGSNSGAAYVVFGQDFNGLATLGSDGDDSLVGTSGGNTLLGGQGDDTLDGGAGNDVLIGAVGNDRLVFDAADTLRVDGGLGFDVLAVGGSAVTLNLTTVNDTEHYALYTGIEIIDLTGTGANTLTLDIQDLFHLSDTANTLRVDGNAGDVVTTADTGWGVGVANVDIAGYTTYTNGEATLIVDSDITRTGIQT